MIFFYLFINFAMLCRILVPWPGIEPVPLAGEARTLTTGHQGSPLYYLAFKQHIEVGTIITPVIWMRRWGGWHKWLFKATQTMPASQSAFLTRMLWGEGHGLRDGHTGVASYPLLQSQAPSPAELKPPGKTDHCFPSRFTLNISD